MPRKPVRKPRPRKKVAPAYDKPSDESIRMTKAEASELLGVSQKLIDALVESGTLEADSDGNVDVNEVTRYATLDPDTERSRFATQQHRALKTSQDHIERLLAIVYEPMQNTHEALLKENASLRERMGTVETRSLETAETYFELMKTILEMQVDAEREQANIEMKKDAMNVLKTQVWPAIRDAGTAKRIVSSLTDAQIEAFLEADVMSAEQSKLLKIELANRKKEREKQNGSGPEGREEEKQDRSR